MKSNGTINLKKWEETIKGISGFDIDLMRCVAIGSLMVTSSPKDFASACDMAAEYMKGRTKDHSDVTVEDTDER